jgi:hypothetical protein
MALFLFFANPYIIKLRSLLSLKTVIILIIIIRKLKLLLSTLINAFGLTGCMSIEPTAFKGPSGKQGY